MCCFTSRGLVKIIYLSLLITKLTATDWTILFEILSNYPNTIIEKKIGELFRGYTIMEDHLSNSEIACSYLAGETWSNLI